MRKAKPSKWVVICFTLLTISVSLAYLHFRRSKSTAEIALEVQVEGNADSNLNRAGNTSLVPNEREPGNHESSTNYSVRDGIEFIWQAPSGNKPIGILFIAHGCKDRAHRFWRAHPSCPRCAGLPENVALVDAARRRGFFVAAASSEAACWDASWPPSSSSDIHAIANLLRTWTNEHAELADLPLFALGSSSGGSFVTILAHVVSLRALAVMISPGVAEALTTELPSGKPFPPTLFVHMPKDKRVEQRVQESLRVLHDKEVEAKELVSRELLVHETFFFERVPGMDKETSRKLHRALLQAGLLAQTDRGCCRLLVDGRKRSWKGAVIDAGVLPLVEKGSGLVLEDEIEEELKVANAFHVISAEHAEAIMDFFTSHL